MKNSVPQLSIRATVRTTIADRRNLLLPLLLITCVAYTPPKQLFAAPGKNAVKTYKLSEGSVLIENPLDATEIVHFEVNFQSGQVNLNESERAMNGILFDLLPMASKKFSKESTFALTEKFSIGMQCGGGIESSSCQFQTVNDHFDQAFDLLSAFLQDPVISQEDFANAVERRIAMFQQDTQNPESYVNTLVNTIFYPAGHPYRLIPDAAATFLKGLKLEQLTQYYSAKVRSSAHAAIYVGPALSSERSTKVKTFLSLLHPKAPQLVQVPAPKVDLAHRVAFEHRPIPTAYIRAKFFAPGLGTPVAAASKVLFEILSEKLHEEVRTKRSLSYSVFGSTLQMSQGIGIVHASTSKPKEAIQVIANVIKELKSKELPKDVLTEYKNVFTTTHYLSLETHDHLSGSLYQAFAYLKDPVKLYEFQDRIAAVTPKDVHNLARELFKDFRVAVVYDQAKFEKKWLKPLLEDLDGK
jgi:predicted Zn-dependent peptidase